MKKETLKNRLINVLKTDVKKFNRYVKFNLSINIEFKADLLSADLSYADLRSANLSYADLNSADLSYADLLSANLSYADLRSANLSYADLNYADLDYSCLNLSCKSLKIKTDEKLRIQIGFYFASLISFSENSTNEEKEILEKIKSYVNKFHRTEVERIK